LHVCLVLICLHGWSRPTWSFVVPLPTSRSASTRASTSPTCLFGIKGFRSWFESQFPHALHAIPTATAHDTFDHVLIDVNQLLHVVLRRSRSQDHALMLLMKELDACLRMATPQSSLVLAMDGPPSACKLATQRHRRLSTLTRTDRKLLQMETLAKTATGNRVFSKTKRDRKKWRLQADTRTLRITPGTDFMTDVEQALLYWAWQRLQNPKLIPSQVQIYISPSTVPGEGEVKLLEWILRQPQALRPAAESIAILGGDSDLVLEGLIIPPSISHNVFVLLPDGSSQYLVVSLWETTRTLAQFLNHTAISSSSSSSTDSSMAYLPRLRTDLVLLLILNGNDYFPKLRGSSGFSKVFHAYLRTLREWLQDTHHPPAFLVDPERLEYNTPFCLAFFRRLEKLSVPASLWQGSAASTAAANRDGRDTHLARFHGLVDAGFFPKPIRWRVRGAEIPSSQGKRKNSPLNQDDDEEDDDDDDDDDDNYNYNDDEDMDMEDEMDDDDVDDDDDDDDEEDEDAMGDDDEMQPQKKRMTTLRIGKPDTQDFLSYEILQPVTTTAKKAKQKLASMALEDLFGDLDNYYENIDNRDATNCSYPWEVGAGDRLDDAMQSHIPRFILTIALVCCRCVSAKSGGSRQARGIPRRSSVEPSDIPRWSMSRLCF
jgi:XRN 5'-3' exonuclease N-terminus